VTIGFLILGIPAKSQDSSKKVTLPDGDAKEIAEKSCSVCHSLTNLTGAHMSLDEWRETVQRMLDNGADVPKDKIDTLVQYLAKNFGPKTAAPAEGAQASASPAPSSTDASPSASSQTKSVTLPDGDGKAIAEKSCSVCHQLTNLTSAHKSLDDWRDTVQRMLDNGADVPKDKLETLIQYLAKNFGPKTAAQSGATSTSPAQP
jgi:cytochrome c5